MIETLAFVLTGLSIAASLVYYANVLRNQNRQRNTTLYLEYFNRIWSEPLKGHYTEIMNWSYDNFDDFETKYGELPDMEGYFKIDKENPLWHLMEILSHNEILGVLWSTNTLDIEMVSRMGSNITAFWEKYGELIYEWRKRRNVPYWWVEYENLYLRILEYWETNSSVSDMTATFMTRRKALGLPTYQTK